MHGIQDAGVSPLGEGRTDGQSQAIGLRVSALTHSPPLAVFSPPSPKL